MSAAWTPGPWKVVTDEHPHFAGGKHIERRIFTAWDHPQMKGPTGVVNLSIGIGNEEGGKPRPFVSIGEADARLIAAAPQMLEALIALRTCFRGDTIAAEIADAAIYLATGERECHAIR